MVPSCAPPVQLDSAALAARDARRRAFLAEQEAETEALLRARPFLKELVVEQPILVAFFPPDQPVVDSVALNQRFEE